MANPNPDVTPFRRLERREGTPVSSIGLAIISTHCSIALSYSLSTLGIANEQ